MSPNVNTIEQIEMIQASQSIANHASIAFDSPLGIASIMIFELISTAC